MLMVGSSKNNGENYPRKCFWTQEKETRVKFNPGLSANRPSNNWALRMGPQNEIYRIYSINHPGRLLNFGPLEWAFIRGWHLFEAGRLLNFIVFSNSVMFILQQNNKW